MRLGEIRQNQTPHINNEFQKQLTPFLTCFKYILQHNGTQISKEHLTIPFPREFTLALAYYDRGTKHQ